VSLPAHVSSSRPERRRRGSETRKKSQGEEEEEEEEKEGGKKEGEGKEEVGRGSVREECSQNLREFHELLLDTIADRHF